MINRTCAVDQLVQNRIHLSGLVLEMPIPLIRRLRISVGDQVIIITQQSNGTALTFFRPQRAKCTVIVDPYYRLQEAIDANGTLVPQNQWHVELPKEIV